MVTTGQNTSGLQIRLVALGLLAAGCGSSEASQESTAQPTASETSSGGQATGEQTEAQATYPCPMRVEGTTVRAHEVEDGAALVFHTSGDVTELRSRVAHMAEMHSRRPRGGGVMMGPRHGRGPGAGPHGGMMDQGTGQGMGQGAGKGAGMPMVPSHAKVQNIEGGAQLVFTPTDPADLDALRENLEQHAQRMGMGQCPMMAAAVTPAEQETKNFEPDSE